MLAALNQKAEGAAAAVDEPAKVEAKKTK